MKRYCTQPACPNPAAYRGLCAVHGKQAEAAAHDAGRKAFYNSAAWRSFRIRRLTAAPFCPCGEVAVDVDHITPLERGGAPFAIENTQPLCKACHGTKTRQERAAGG